MPRKKILWLCSWYPDRMEPFNGDFIQRHAIAAALYNDIYVIHVAGDTSGKCSDTEHVITCSEGLAEHIGYFKRSASFLEKFWAYYRWRAVFKKAIRQYISENGKPDLVHVHVPMRAGLFGIRIKKKIGIPYVITEHWTIYQPQNAVKYDQHKALFKSVLYWVVKNSRLLLPVSNDLGLLMNKLVTKKEFFVIENVANEKYFYYTDLVKPGSPFRFIHVSNMTFQKNAEAIVECFTAFQEKFHNTELVLVGSVPASMQLLIEQTGLLGRKIFLKGEISYTAVASEMQQANALVMFSRFENSPCSIIEALCCGLPVIATRVGGIPELLENENGILVESMDKMALGEALEKMVTGYPGYDRKTIAEKAKNRFSYPVIGKKLDDVYTSLSIARS
ncbi:MAG: glycosyltransferase [Ferruginibacter sp.]|nr:glycosyltransferase [Chitinophagaceae bacterium]